MIKEDLAHLKAQAWAYIGILGVAALLLLTLFGCEGSGSAQADPAPTPPVVTLDAPETPTVPTVMLLGDSVTLSARTESPDKYSDHVSRVLNVFAAWEVVNEGRGGETVDSGKARFGLLPTPDVLIIGYGLNDSIKRTVVFYETTLGELIDAALARGATVLVSLPTPFVDSPLNAGLQPYLEAAKRVCQPPCSVIDQHSLIAETAHLEPYLNDGVHFNATGNRLLGMSTAMAILRRTP